MSRKRKTYTAEFKAGAVRLVRSGKRVSEAARDLGVSTTAVGRWMAQAEVDGGRGGSGALTTSEREELTRLRKANKILEMEREILKKATAFFAKQS